MSNSIISVQNLSKKYSISLQQDDYTSFRDVLTNTVKGKHNPFASKFQTQEFLALNDVNFNIERGDKVGIIGRNGAGKSTLLKILSRITQPTSGRISLRGRVASLLEVGTGFHPELSGRENIFLNGAILGMRRSEIVSKFDEIVSFAEVEKFIDTPVKRYSSGMYVRLAFSVAAHLEPEILIVDEVLAVGDAQFQKKCLGRMEEVGKEGRTVLFVSHNVASIRHLCSKGLLLRSGQLVEFGNINSVINNYSFNGETPQNVSRWDRPGVFKRAGFSAIEIQDSQRESSSLIAFQSEFNINFEINTSEKLHLTVGFAIENADGVIITSSHSNEVGLGLVEETPPLEFNGKGKLQCRITQNFLRPGLYKLHCSLFNRSSKTVFDQVENALHFEIHSSGASTSFSDYQSGVVVTRSFEWKQTEFKNG